MIKCPQYSKEYSDKVELCPNCGNMIIKEQQEQAKITNCSECDRAMSQELDVCPHCGYPVNSNITISNKKTAKKKFLFISSIVATAIVGILIAIFVFTLDNNTCSFDWRIKQQTLESKMKQEPFGTDPYYNCISYKQKDIKFFENQEVIVLYYFSGKDNQLSKVIYDVSKNNKDSIYNFIEYLNKKCKKINFGTKSIGTFNYIGGEWESHTTLITYEQMGSSWIKFYFSPKD